MKFTLKENINTQSFVLKHEILLQASELAMGREGVLQTEKDLYLMMSFINNLIEEDLIDSCNKDERDLTTIVLEDIEPYFFNLIKEEKYKELYNEMRALFLQRCKEIWDNQHSIVGVMDSILTSIATMSPEDKKEVLEKTGEIAEKAFDRRTEAMEKKADETNNKLEAFVRAYKEKELELAEQQKQKVEENKENKKEENDAK